MSVLLVSILDAMFTVRHEIPEDISAIRRVTEMAFNGKTEADIVDALRENGHSVLSLVAVQDEHVIGHVMFSPVNIVSDTEVVDAVSLGPMAVLPDLQRKGVGSELVRRGLGELRQSDYGVCVVLGHATFYPRFGFSPAQQFRIRCKFDVPDEAFMVMELHKGALAQIQGTVEYSNEFDVDSVQ